MNDFNKNVSDRCFTDTSKIVSCDNITAKWLKTIISSILLGEKTFYIAFRLIIKLFIISTDHYQGLLNVDGSVCKTNKNKLDPMLISKSDKENTTASKENTAYVVDLMELMRVVTPISESFEDLALKLILTLSN